MSANRHDSADTRLVDLAAMKDAAPPEIFLNPEQAAQRRLEVKYQGNVFTIPRLRLIGFSLLALVGVPLHNIVISHDFSARGFITFAIITELYCALSWLALHRYYEKLQPFELGDVFLYADLLLVAGAVYVTGGEQSWFFWLPLIRVFDQSMFGFRRSISFVLASTGVFVALWLYLWLFEQRPIDVNAELAKTVFVAVSGFYIALTSRAFGRVRSKLVSTVRFARHAMVELRDKTEALSNATRRAQQNSQAKSEFLARVSHELRRPATSVIGFAQLLEMDELNEKPRDYAARILRSGQELGLMIDEVMDMAEMQSGSVVLAPRAMSLSDVVDEALAQVWPLAASRGVRLLSDENADTTLRIWSDPRGMRRVLINTIAHAVRYSAEGDRVFVTWARQEARARIMVRDSGHGGLSESDEQVLARGGRLDEDITRLQELGLGLAFVKALVISLNGQVGADLAAREGATYWIDMPLTEAPPIAS